MKKKADKKYIDSHEHLFEIFPGIKEDVDNNITLHHFQQLLLMRSFLLFRI